MDLRELRFVDLAGLRVLLESDARAREDGLHLSFVAGEAVTRLFAYARTPDPLNCVDAPPA